MDLFLWIKALGSFQQNLFGFRVHRVGNATIVDRTDRCTLWLIKMADTLGTALMGDDVDAVSYALAIADMISLRFCVTACLKDRFVGTLWKTGTTGDTFIGD